MFPLLQGVELAPWVINKVKGREPESKVKGVGTRYFPVFSLHTGLIFRMWRKYGALIVVLLPFKVFGGQAALRDRFNGPTPGV